MKEKHLNNKIDNSDATKEYVKLEQALIASEARFRVIFDKAAIGIIVVDNKTGLVLDANPAIERILGYTKEELKDLLLIDITHPDDLDITLNRFEELKNNRLEQHQLEKRYIRKDGKLIWVKMITTLVKDTEGQNGFIFGLIEDITERKELENSLKKARLEAERAREAAERLADTDCLTGLYNRRAFINLLKDEIERGKSSNKGLAVILMDVDFFKEVNDTYGHLAGDKVLQEIGQTILRNLRNYDFVGRYGGEEFIICLPETIRNQASAIAERIRTAIASKPICLTESNENIYVTVSMGITTWSPEQKEGIENLIKGADRFLYEAKRQGRNKICLTNF